MKIEEYIIYINRFLLEMDLDPIWLFIILFGIAMSKSTAILSSFLPPASIILLTSITSSISKLNINLIWLAITLGSTTGSIISYCLGKKITNKNLFNRFINRHQSTINNAHNKLQKNGITLLFTSRFIAMLRYIIPLVAGMLLMNRNKVYSTCLLSSAIWALMLILIVKGIIKIIATTLL